MNQESHVLARTRRGRSVVSGQPLPFGRCDHVTSCAVFCQKTVRRPSNALFLAATDKPVTRVPDLFGSNRTRFSSPCRSAKHVLPMVPPRPHHRSGRPASKYHAKQAPRRRGVSRSYDELAWGLVEEESLWDGRQAVRQEWVLRDSILSLHENQPANPLFTVTNC
jgi:hypothetical protein